MGKIPPPQKKKKSKNRWPTKDTNNFPQKRKVDTANVAAGKKNGSEMALLHVIIIWN